MENNNTDELEKLRIENDLLKEKLKKYTAPARSKTYYENHKEEILIKKKEGADKDDPLQKERRKVINKKAYQKRKENPKGTIEENI